MNPDRSERNRELIEKSAALLAADYPLEVLIERFCNTIAAGMDATVFVALPNEDGTMRLSYATQRGQRQETHDLLMAEDSRVAAVFTSGRSLLFRASSEWEGRESFEIDGGDAERIVSALYVPVIYGETTLGVLCVAHAQPEAFGRDDVRLIESMARHLAIAVRNQRSLTLATKPVRYPWALAGAIFAVVVVAIAVLSLWTANRWHAAADTAANDRVAFARNESSELERKLVENGRLATIAASVVGPVRADPTLARVLISRLLSAHEDENADGIGVFWEPNVFDAGDYAEYVSLSGTTMRAHVHRSGYTSQPWYRIGRGAQSDARYTEPYDEHGASYISALRAFPSRGSVAGVVAVDTLTSRIVSYLRAQPAPQERAYVTDRTGRIIVDTRSATTRGSIETVAPLGVSGWMLHVIATDVASRAQRSILAYGLGSIVLVGSFGLFLLIALHYLTRARRDAFGLRAVRAELQGEIATRMDAEERLRAAAYHDALTGLPNRAFFLDQLADVLEQRRLGTGLDYAVLFIDLDRFYVVNDSMGHSVGDELLRAIAFRLEEVLPPHALIARLGGDEFVLLLPSEGPVIREAIAIAEDVLEALRNPFSIGDREVYSGASIGIVKLDESYQDAETILRDADISMYQAKRSGRARYAVFDHAMRERVTQQLSLEGALRGAVERREILPYYQPIVRVSDEAIVGFEMLARWRREGDIAIAAGDFIPVAEQTGMMRAIDADLFKQACRDVVEMARRAPEIRVSVNISANDLTRASLLSDIDAMMQLFSTPASMLKIEITETAVMEDAERALAMLGDLRARGLEIVVDDFGAGYSSLSYLQRLPLAGVKIDRSFIHNLPGELQSLEIVRAIVALAKTLGLHVTAEGVERAEQLDLLRELGVDYAQGFWFSPAMTFDEAMSLFAVGVE